MTIRDYNKRFETDRWNGKACYSLKAANRRHRRQLANGLQQLRDFVLKQSQTKT